MDTKAFHALSYGMYIVASGDANGKAGCVVNTFAQITGNPARASVAVNKENATADVIRRIGRYTASVLTEEAPMTLIGRFGFRSSTDYDKFAETVYAIDSMGMPTVTDHAAACFEVRVTDAIDVGSHWLFLGDVVDAHVLSSDAPMTYAYYHQVKGGKTPPKASSYIDEEKPVVAAHKADEKQDGATPESKSAAAEEAEAQADSDTDPKVSESPAQTNTDSAATQTAENDSAGNEPAASQKPGTSTWRCMLCGYQVTIDGDELPANFTCPMCGAGRDMFERVS